MAGMLCSVMPYILLCCWCFQGENKARQKIVREVVFLFGLARVEAGHGRQKRKKSVEGDVKVRFE